MAICSVPECTNSIHSRGLCNGHYQQNRVGKELAPLRTIRQGEDRKSNPLYDTYRQMLQRCGNPNHKYFSYYGGRGIKVCDRWKGPDGFNHFLADMGPKREGLTLDRHDNDGDYAPENCGWETRTTQQINQRLAENNTSGTKGVHWFKNANAWSVYIDYKGTRKHLGYYKDKADAIKVRMDAELERLLDNIK
jgi:hypothetical protein